MENSNSVKKVVTTSPISVDKVYTSEWQKENTKTAQLRQEVTIVSSYPSQQVSNSHQDNPFSVEEFGFGTQEYENKEKRVAWIDVPPQASVSDVLGKIPNDATLYRVMSNRPIITDSQAYAIDNPEIELSLDDIANRQAVRYGEGHEKAGQLIPDANGKPQYRAIFYSNSPKEDVDLRTEAAEDMYMSPEIRAEIVGASAIVTQRL